MTGTANHAQFLLDVTRLIWRRWKGRHPTGIDRVCLAYLRHFGDRSQAVIQHRHFRRILGRTASAELFGLLEGPPNIFRRRLPWQAIRHLGSLNSPGRGRIYLNIGHTGLDSVGFRQWTTRADVRPVYFVHDIIPITDPEFCRAGEADRHRERMRTVLATAAGVIGNSRATLDELASFSRSEVLPNPPGVPAWLGTDVGTVKKESLRPESPTFVVLGTIEARKNHIALLEIWSRLIDRLDNAAPRLLIIGQRGWEADRVFQLLDGDAKLRGFVSELNHCSDEQLAEHLASARALLFPSLAEGYGLPLVEALRLGTPVIASDLPVFREIGGDIPEYLEADDRGGWEAAILEYVRPDSSRRAAQITRMEGFRPPSWADHFGIVERFLADLS